MARPDRWMSPSITCGWRIRPATRSSTRFRPRSKEASRSDSSSTPTVARSARGSSLWSAMADGTRVGAAFCPGRRLTLVHAMSRSMGSAQKRIRVCSPVITSGPTLGTVAEVVEQAKVDIAGVYDATQMDEVQRQWGAQGGATWKIAAFHTIIGAARFGSKRSTPYANGTVHDFMHAKIL